MNEATRKALGEVRNGIVDAQLRGNEGIDELREIRAELRELAKKAADHIDYVIERQED